MNMKKIAVGIVTMILIMGFFALLSADAQKNIKLPDVNGQFYPANKDVLSAEIDSFLKQVPEQSEFQDRSIVGLMVPHAGYMYSGQVAAHAFKLLEGRKVDTVVIIASAHFSPLDGIVVYAEGAFRTPLGDIAIDEAFARTLINSNAKISFLPHAFKKEHPIEVELPFLQKVLGDFKIVPVVIGDVGYGEATMLAEALLKASEGKNIAVVASSDLSHFYPYETAVKKDSATISFVKAIDPRGLWASVIRKECEMCGFYPVITLLEYARLKQAKVQFLAYANSGDVTGDKSRVVGYSSFVFYSEEFSGKDSNKLQSEAKEEGGDVMFTEKQKKRLLEIARQTIIQYVKENTIPEFKEDDAALQIQRGAFVTLRKHGQLRGCIGSFGSDQPIYKEISRIAIESATKDPRFSPVSINELDEIDIEISVLTEPALIDDWRKIRLGVDGVIVRSGFGGGVFLPQVATETGWDLETFLRHLCADKAGLPADAYKKPGVRLFTFQAHIFLEKEE